MNDDVSACTLLHCAETIHSFIQWETLGVPTYILQHQGLIEGKSVDLNFVDKATLCS